jgi:uncharacterized membrane protein
MKKEQNKTTNNLLVIAENMAIQFGHLGLGSWSVKLTSPETCIGRGSAYHTIRTKQVAEPECILDDNGHIVAIGYICEKHKDYRGSFRDVNRPARNRRGEIQLYEMSSKYNQAIDLIREARNLLSDAKEMSNNKYIKYSLNTNSDARHIYENVKAKYDQVRVIETLGQY